MKKVEKQALVHAIVIELRRSLQAAEAAAESATEAATHSESRAESKWDTFGLESSYLAGAQQSRVEMLKEAVYYFEKLRPEPVGETDAIVVGALVEVCDETDTGQFFYLAGQGAGTAVKVDNIEVKVLTPASPMGRALIGRHAGEAVELVIQGRAREFDILSVQ